MAIDDTLAQDLKAAMLAGDAVRVSVLRSLKSAILYAKVAPGADKKNELDDVKVLGLFAKEAKKRQESADAYTQAGDSERAKAEIIEKQIIEEYLPVKLTEEAVRDLIESAVGSIDVSSPQALGLVIGRVKQAAGAGADGAMIARFAKERLSQ